MRLCLDEHYSPQIATDLRAAGYDVTSVKERPELQSLSDAELLAAVTTERRALLTENVADFARLIAQLASDGESHFGVIYSTNKTMPGSKATIGRYVAALAALMDRFAVEDAFVDRVEWLQPPADVPKARRSQGR